MRCETVCALDPQHEIGRIEPERIRLAWIDETDAGQVGDGQILLQLPLVDLAGEDRFGRVGLGDVASVLCWPAAQFDDSGPLQGQQLGVDLIRSLSDQEICGARDELELVPVVGFLLFLLEPEGLLHREVCADSRI